jgi:hypothetical protein
VAAAINEDLPRLVATGTGKGAPEGRRPEKVLVRAAVITCPRCVPRHPRQAPWSSTAARISSTSASRICVLRSTPM